MEYTRHKELWWKDWEYNEEAYWRISDSFPEESSLRIYKKEEYSLEEAISKFNKRDDG